MQRWEYKTLTVPDARLTRDLNQLGDQGWEAISSWEVKHGIHSTQVRTLLKREVLESAPRRLPQSHQLAGS